MKIECLFIIRDEHSGPELLVAWDEYTVDQNPEGYQKECDKELKDLGVEWASHRYIAIDVSDDDLMKAMGKQEIRGKIK